jgi:hypothetical protein
VQSEKIESLLDEIRKLKTDKVNNFQYSRISKIPWRVHSYNEIMNSRMVDFCESANLLIKSDHIIPSLSSIRSLFENLAITYRIVLAVEATVKSKKLVENFDDLITKIAYGTGYDSDVERIQILNNIDKLDNDFKDIRKFYKSFCEFVHPNWDGVEGAYSELSEIDNTTEIKKIVTIDHPIYQWIEACFLLCMNLYIGFSKSIKTNLQDFAKICESEK